MTLAMQFTIRLSEQDRANAAIDADPAFLDFLKFILHASDEEIAEAVADNHLAANYIRLAAATVRSDSFVRGARRALMDAGIDV